MNMVRVLMTEVCHQIQVLAWLQEDRLPDFVHKALGSSSGRWGRKGVKCILHFPCVQRAKRNHRSSPESRSRKMGGYQRLGSRFMVTFSVTKTCHLFLHPSSYHICLKVILLYKIKELPPLQSFMRFELPRHSQICPFSWSYLKSSDLSFIL